jgi:hypothetical protein
MATICDAEKAHRRESTECAFGTLAMSGMFPDAETMALFNRYVEGEFTREELSATLDLHVADILRASGRDVPPHLIAKR